MGQENSTTGKAVKSVKDGANSTSKYVKEKLQDMEMLPAPND